MRTQRRRAAYSQNFLHSRQLVSALVERSSIGSDDVVIEIGPGRGIITDALASRSRHVITIEKDPRYASQVSRRFGDRANVTVFACDILDFPLPETPFKVFANIPYRITTAIVDYLTTGVAPPVDAYLTVQQEAAARFTGEDEASMVSTCMKPWFEMSIVHRFRRRDFVPRPSVDSVLLRISRREPPLIPWDEREQFRRVVEAIYSAWQPTVVRALRRLLPRDIATDVTARSEVSLAVRPAQLPIEGWIAVYEVLSGCDDDRAWASIDLASGRLRRQQEELRRPTRTGGSRRELSVRSRGPRRREPISGD